MSDIVVHGVPGSPFVRSVEMGLHEKGAAYRLQAISLGETKSEAYLKKNPFERVPLLEHGDFSLYETQAIFRYLDDVFPEPPFEPADARAAARMNQIIGINDWYFFQKVAAVVVGQRIVGPALLGRKTDEAVIAAALPMGQTCIMEFDRLIGFEPFLAGSSLSIADLVLAPPLDFLMATPEGRALIEGTRLEDWLKRMNSRPSMLATQRPQVLRQTG